MKCLTNLASHPTNNLRFYAKLAELRQRIRANSMPVLNKELETHEDPVSRPARKSMSEVPNVSKNNMLSHSASLPRPARAARLPSLVESQQLQLELRELEKSPRIDSKRDMEPSPRTINQPPELSPRTIPTDQEQFSKSDPERPPLPPKPSPPSFSNFIIAPQPFRRAEGEHEAPSLAQQAIQSWYSNTFLVLLFRLISHATPSSFHTPLCHRG